MEKEKVHSYNHCGKCMKVTKWKLIKETTSKYNQEYWTAPTRYFLLKCLSCGKQSTWTD